MLHPGPKDGDYAPCLSCSTHAAGQIALHIQLHGPDGALLDELRQG
jgi:NAD-reducing hydrogenase large subunit